MGCRININLHGKCVCSIYVSIGRVETFDNVLFVRFGFNIHVRNLFQLKKTTSYYLIYDPAYRMGEREY